MSTTDETRPPTPFAYILSFLLVSLCWGFTTPFIRRAALTYRAPTEDLSKPWLTRKLNLGIRTLISLLTKPSYAIPLVANLTGSIWFFLLVGQAGKFTSHGCSNSSWF